MITRGVYVQASTWYDARVAAAAYLELGDPLDRRMICARVEAT